jgi:hypothetical protein
VLVEVVAADDGLELAARQLAQDAPRAIVAVTGDLAGDAIGLDDEPAESIISEGAVDLVILVILVTADADEIAGEIVFVRARAVVDQVAGSVVPGMTVACSAGESREHGQNRRNWACRRSRWHVLWQGLDAQGAAPCTEPCSAWPRNRRC